MGALSLLNFVLLAIPIGTTLGVLLGIQSHRLATGQEPLFKPDNPTDNPDGSPKKGDNGIKIEYYCDETIGISPASQGDHYTRTYCHLSCCVVVELSQGSKTIAHVCEYIQCFPCRPIPLPQLPIIIGIPLTFRRQ